MLNRDNLSLNGTEPLQSELNVAPNHIQSASPTLRQNHTLESTVDETHVNTQNTLQANSSQIVDPPPNYNDNLPPYPTDEISVIGWSPRVVIVDNNSSPNPQFFMPMPIMQNNTTEIYQLRNETLPVTYALPRTLTSQNTSPNVRSRVIPVSNQTSGRNTSIHNIRNHGSNQWYTNESLMNQEQCMVCVTFLIVAVIGILVIITIYLVTRNTHHILSNS